jgi:hypothetical protein
LLELDRRSQIRRPIRVSHPPNVLSTSPRDRDTVPVYMAAALHPAYPRPKASTRLCPLPSQGDLGSLHRSTNESLSHKRSSQRIHANEELHSKAREAKNWSPRRGLAPDLLWQHPPHLRRNLPPLTGSSNRSPGCSINILIDTSVHCLSVHLCLRFPSGIVGPAAFRPSPATSRPVLRTFI